MDWMTRYHQFEQQALGLHPRMRPDDIKRAIIVSPRHRYLYTNMPKVACSTIRKLLIDAEYEEVLPYADRADMHYNEFLPFLNIQQVGDLRKFLKRQDIFKFTFVRNPYTRLLSGYLDKIVRKKDQRNPILRQLGRFDQPDCEISFAEFVEAVIHTPVPHQDAHWRIQYYHCARAGINYDFIGRFENLEDDLRHVAERLGITEYIQADTFRRGTTAAAGQEHATGAAALLEQYYTPEVRDKVYKAYEIDFTTFGYAQSLPKT